jgi:hypothetical protein
MKFLIGHYQFFETTRLYTTKFHHLIKDLLEKEGFELLYDTSRFYCPGPKHSSKTRFPTTTLRRLLGTRYAKAERIVYFNFHVLRFPVLSQLFTDWRDPGHIRLYAIYDEWEWSKFHLAVLRQESQKMRRILAFSPASYQASRLFRPKITILPNFAPENMVLDFNPNPVPKVTLTGVIAKNYHGRQLAQELTLRHPSQWECLSHPSQDFGNKYAQVKHDVVGRKYGEFLNQHLASLTCPGSQKTVDGVAISTLITKHFEILASGSLLLTSVDAVPGLAKLGLRRGEHYLAYEYTRESLEELVEEILAPENRQRIDDIRKRGQEAARANHLSIHRAREIDRLTT